MLYKYIARLFVVYVYQSFPKHRHWFMFNCSEIRVQKLIYRNTSVWQTYNKQ